MKTKFFRWVHGLTTLFDGIATTVSLGFWWPNLSFHFIVWESKRQLKQK